MIPDLLTRIILERDDINILFKMKDVNLSTIDKRLLLDYHRKCHMLYNASRSRNNKVFINSIVSLHDKIVKEMLKRGIKHNTPLKKI